MDPRLKPSTWGSWLLDDKGALVPNSRFQVGSGDFSQAYVRRAYDKSVDLLNRTNDADGLIQFEKLEWG